MLCASLTVRSKDKFQSKVILFFPFFLDRYISLSALVTAEMTVSFSFSMVAPPETVVENLLPPSMKKDSFMSLRSISDLSFS